MHVRYFQQHQHWNHTPVLRQRLLLLTAASIQRKAAGIYVRHTLILGHSCHGKTAQAQADHMACTAVSRFTLITCVIEQHKHAAHMYSSQTGINIYV